MGGQPKGIKNAVDVAVVERSHCPKCGSSRRSEYWGRMVQKCPGLCADGTPYAAIIRRSGRAQRKASRAGPHPRAASSLGPASGERVVNTGFYGPDGLPPDWPQNDNVHLGYWSDRADTCAAVAKWNLPGGFEFIG